MGVGPYRWVVAALVAAATPAALVLARRRRAGPADPVGMLDLLPDAVLIRDAGDRITYCNRAAETMYGWRRAELLGRVAPDLLDSHVPVYAGTWTGEVTHRRRDGSRITVLSRQAVRTDAGGRRIAVIEVNSDVAGSQQLDQLKTDLIATVSHELRTPLTSIRGYTELLIDGDAGELEPVQRRMIDVIDSNGARLLTLVEDLLAFSRVDDGTLTFAAEPVDLGTVIRSAVRPGVRCEIAPDLPPVTGDPHHLARAVQHLVGNAVKFSPGGGEVAVRARPDAGGVAIEVTDHGIGIAADEHERLFQRFARTATAQDGHFQGAGLGLAMVKTIMEGHGGRVGIRSAVGAGTTVTLWLPAGGPSAASGPATVSR